VDGYSLSGSSDGSGFLPRLQPPSCGRSCAALTRPALSTNRSGIWSFFGDSRLCRLSVMRVVMFGSVVLGLGWRVN